jgi:hypothetical protein
MLTRKKVEKMQWNNISTKEAKRLMIKKLPELRRALKRLEEAGKVSRKTLEMRFMA